MTHVPPPLPASLAFDSSLDWWSGTVELDAFKGIRISVPEPRSAPPSIELIVALNPRAVRAGQLAPSPAQAAAYGYLLENQQRVVDVTLATIASGAAEQRGTFAQFYEPAVLDQLLPVGPSAEQLRTRVRLGSIQIAFREKDGFAYSEYGFSCAWDREHRLMVVLHNDRLVYFGGTGDGWRDRDGATPAG